MADPAQGPTRDEIADDLDRPLGPEYVSFKNGHAYIEGHKVVNLANEIFGFDGWSSEVKNMVVDYVEEKQGRYTLGISCTMRITLGSGVFREDIGYGSSINMPNRYQAYDKARKEAVTDAMKRAFRQFGESLGNCLYNKAYVNVVQRVAKEKVTFDENDMRRPRKRLQDEAFGDMKRPRATAEAGIGHGTFGHSRPPLRSMISNRTAAPIDTKPDAVFVSDDDVDDLPVPAQDTTNVEPVFVTADRADLLRSPGNQSTPLPDDVLFDVSRQSQHSKSTVPQDRSMPVARNRA